ncbi:hypothetical protein B0T14DRAFT_42511 [Immersiella caudata]|uniref:Uncharacterized protein n=1 Tax=Immersiella caudata TaxID=314043 RepID=A0AA39XF14_9PEZI|nr:hypothetical protein B0T14DRAFT_42511 [Immersiella caudata]
MPTVRAAGEQASMAWGLQISIATPLLFVACFLLFFFPLLFLFEAHEVLTATPDFGRSLASTLDVGSGVHQVFWFSMLLCKSRADPTCPPESWCFDIFPPLFSKTRLELIRLPLRKSSTVKPGPSRHPTCEGHSSRDLHGG